MKVASGCASGPEAVSELAELAVAAALSTAGAERAEHVLLLLSREFARHCNEAVRAAARRAGCLQVSGGVVSGLFTEAGVLRDQPAAAALVMADMATAPSSATAPLLCFTGRSTLPAGWLDQQPRAGLLEPGVPVWSHARLATDGCAEIRLPELETRLLRADGQRILDSGLRVDACSGHELRRVAGQSAAASLHRALPADARDHPPLHRLSVLPAADAPALAVLSINADGSLTLAGPLAEGQQIAWGMRQPLATEAEMRSQLAGTADEPPPDFALMLSCIGRGPLFYGGEDRDLLTFRQRFPGVPLLGAYGSGQIAPTPAGNRLFHNTAVTLLYRSHHV